MDEGESNPYNLGCILALARNLVLGPGIDSGLQGPQPRVLPLHYPSKLVPSVGFEPTLG